MAEAVGQLTGKPAAVLGTRAVGAANMAIGIHTARQNSTPMVALLGQVQRDFTGPRGVPGGGSGRDARPPGEMGGADRRSRTTRPRLVGEGLSAMLSGRPGPGALRAARGRARRRAREPAPLRARPIDGPARPDTATAFAPSSTCSPGRAAGDPRRLRRHRCRRHGRTGGAQRALGRARLRRLAPADGISQRPSELPGHDRLRLAAHVVRERLRGGRCPARDRLPAERGRHFDYAIPAADTRWAHVDLEPRTAHAGLRAPDIALAADAAAFLEVARSKLARAHGAAASTRARCRPRRVSGRDVRCPSATGRARASIRRTSSPCCSASCADDAIVTTDAGNFGLWPARYFKFGRDQVFLGPTSGAMGYGLPAAIAASLSQPDRQVVALCGDGGLAMTMNELETAVRTGATAGRARLRQRALRHDRHAPGQRAARSVATELGPIDFAAVARACGAQGVRVDRRRRVRACPARRPGGRRDRRVLHLELDPRWVSARPNAG